MATKPSPHRDDVTHFALHSDAMSDDVAFMPPAGLSSGRAGKSMLDSSSSGGPDLTPILTKIFKGRAPF